MHSWDATASSLNAPACYRHDASMLDWPENDFRIFVGDLGNEANDDVLAKAFNKFATFQKARIVRDKKSNKTKGAALETMLLKGCVGFRNTAQQRPSDL